ncbi:MAG: N-acetyl-gamma-glutamyl-phosphate reductase, partial [Chloroflexi bacterium]|nr:N-acetyl-gamma-glutamyl-phosphate reductase [Chloroflexota bacterium]
MRAAIVNVTGYAGVELARLLHFHPDVELVQVTGRGAVGERLTDAFPHLPQDLPIVEEVTESVDVVFVALPHKAAAAVIPDLLSQGVKVVDISA